MSGSAKLNWVLLLAVIGVFALSWYLEPDPTQRNFMFLPGMVSAVPYESFTANPVLAGGATMQLPPAGAIARGYAPIHFEATPEEAERAGRELENPFSADDLLALEQGERVFETYCQLCHGSGGEGDGTVAMRGFPTPPSLLAPKARELPDGRIFHIATFGQGNMPSHAAQIEPEERWKAVLWVRQLQAAAPPVIEEQIDEGVGAEMVSVGEEGEEIVSVSDPEVDDER